MTAPSDRDSSCDGITLRRSAARLHHRGDDREVWLTFHRPLGVPNSSLAPIVSFEEARLPPGTRSRRQRHRDGDILTFVREGGLAYANSMGQTGVVHAGEFLSRNAASRISYREANASRTDATRLFQIALPSSETELEPSLEQKRFSVAERRERLRLVASRDGRCGSLRIHADALVYSALLYAGQHVVHELAAGRSVWIHVVDGEVAFGDNVLTTGDGLGVVAARAVSFRARVSSELLLLDLAQHPEHPMKMDTPLPPVRVLQSVGPVLKEARPEASTVTWR
jgi:quercetin 2,3-dioxygenase